MLRYWNKYILYISIILSIALYISTTENKREKYESFLVDKYNIIPVYSDEELEEIPKPEHPHMATFQNNFMTVDPEIGYVPSERLYRAFLEKQNIRNAIIFAIVSALLINVRILGLFLPMLISLICLINILREQNNKKKLIISLLVLLIFTPVFIILFWPYLWESPIEHFLYSFKFLSAHNLNIYSYYLGKYIFSANPPWHYSLVWIFISTPFFYTI